MVERTGLRRDPLPVKRPVQPLIDRMAARLDKVLFGGGLEKLGAKMAFGGMVPANRAPFIPSIHFIEASNAQGGGAGTQPVDDLTAAQKTIAGKLENESKLHQLRVQAEELAGKVKYNWKKQLVVSLGLSIVTTLAGGIAVSAFLPFGIGAAAIVGLPLALFTGIYMLIGQSRYYNRPKHAAKAEVNRTEKNLAEAQAAVFAGTEIPGMLKALARELAGRPEEQKARIISLIKESDPPKMAQLISLTTASKKEAEVAEKAVADAKAQAEYDALPLQTKLQKGSWPQLVALLAKIKADIASDKNPWPADKLDLREVALLLEAKNLHLERIASKGQLDQTQGIIKQDISDLLMALAGELEKQ